MTFTGYMGETEENCLYRSAESELYGGGSMSASMANMLITVFDTYDHTGKGMVHSKHLEDVFTQLDLQDNELTKKAKTKLAKTKFCPLGHYIYVMHKLYKFGLLPAKSLQNKYYEGRMRNSSMTMATVSQFTESLYNMNIKEEISFSSTKSTDEIPLYGRQHNEYEITKDDDSNDPTV